MLSTMIRACPSTHQRPSPENRVSRESQYQHRALRAAKRRASQLGYQLVPMSDAQHHDPGVPLNPPAAIA